MSMNRKPRYREHSQGCQRWFGGKCDCQGPDTMHDEQPGGTMLVKRLTIAIDLDNTVIFHGKEELIPGAKAVLQKWKEQGHRLVLWTCRDHAGARAKAAWLMMQHGIVFHSMNAIEDQPTDSPKVHADLYVDDRAVGCPMMPRFDEDGEWAGTIVNWQAIDDLVQQKASV